MELLAKKWAELGAVEDYQKLRETATVLATWDDHDYDLASSGMTNTHKGWASATNSFRVGEAHPVQNAGLIEIDWAAKSFELSIINKNGEKVLQHPLRFSELEFE